MGRWPGTICRLSESPSMTSDRSSVLRILGGEVRSDALQLVGDAVVAAAVEG